MCVRVLVRRAGIRRLKLLATRIFRAREVIQILLQQFAALQVLIRHHHSFQVVPPDVWLVAGVPLPGGVEEFSDYAETVVVP